MGKSKSVKMNGKRPTIDLDKNLAKIYTKENSIITNNSLNLQPKSNLEKYTQPCIMLVIHNSQTL